MCKLATNRHSTETRELPKQVALLSLKTLRVKAPHTALEPARIVLGRSVNKKLGNIPRLLKRKGRKFGTLPQRNQRGQKGKRNTIDVQTPKGISAAKAKQKAGRALKPPWPQGRSKKRLARIRRFTHSTEKELRIGEAFFQTSQTFAQGTCTHTHTHTRSGTVPLAAANTHSSYNTDCRLMHGEGVYIPYVYTVRLQGHRALPCSSTNIQTEHFPASLYKCLRQELNAAPAQPLLSLASRRYRSFAKRVPKLRVFSKRELVTTIQAWGNLSSHLHGRRAHREVPFPDQLHRSPRRKRHTMGRKLFGRTGPN